MRDAGPPVQGARKEVGVTRCMVADVRCWVARARYGVDVARCTLGHRYETRSPVYKGTRSPG